MPDIFGTDLPQSEGASDKVSRYNLAFATHVAVKGGKLLKSVAGSANVTLTSGEALNAVMEFTGVLTGNISVLLPVPAGTPAGYSAREFIVHNNTTGDFTLTVKTTAVGSTGKVVARGARAKLFHDGTNVDGVTEATAINSESVLGADLVISTDDTWEDSGLSLALPSAGTYLINANIRLALDLSAGSGFLKGKLYNSTDAADVANSERMLLYAEDTAARATTVPLQAQITVAAAKTIKLYGFRSSGGTYTESKFRSNSDGRTVMSYVKIG